MTNAYTQMLLQFILVSPPRSSEANRPPYQQNKGMEEKVFSYIRSSHGLTLQNKRACDMLFESEKHDFRTVIILFIPQFAG